MHSLRILLVPGAITLALVAYTGGSTPAAGSTLLASATQSAVEQAVLNAYAVALLTEIFGESGKTFEATNPSMDVRSNFTSSQDLVTQLGEGVDIDVLATASEFTTKKATDASQVDMQTVFITNALTLITTPGNPTDITGPDSPLEGTKLVICTLKVLCGKFVKTFTEKPGVTLNPAPEKQVVTDMRDKVSSGQTDAGIVYEADTLAEGDAVDTVEIQGAGKTINKYSITLVSTSTKKDLGQKRIDLVLFTDGQEVLESVSFTPAVE